MDPVKPRRGRRFMTGLLRTFTVLLLIALVGAVGWLVSERNARTFTLGVENGKLVVLKGRMLPTGADPWTPGDPMLADTYAPIPLEGVTPSQTLLDARFSDRDELDRALFRVLEELARPRIRSDDEKALEQGLYYLRRAQRLTGLSQEQRITLERMQTEVAFYQAKLKLDVARRTVAEAITQLELAANAQGPNAQRAARMVQTIIGPARSLERALRTASEAADEGAPEVPAQAEPASPAPTPEKEQAPEAVPTAPPPTPDAGAAPQPH